MQRPTGPSPVHSPRPAPLAAAVGLVALALLAACGGSSSKPARVVGFVAADPILEVGASTSLTATFEGASASIDQGVGTVRSGEPVTVTPGASTVYTLTVIGDDRTVTATASIQLFDTVLVVTTAAASGPGSLAEAVVAGGGGATTTAIVFDLPAPAAGAPAVIPLEATLRLQGPLSIFGPGPARLTLSGGGARRIAFVQGGQVHLEGVTLADGLAAGGRGGDGWSGGGGGGAAGMGGALFVNGGAVTLRDVVFSGNRAQGGAGGVRTADGLVNGGGGGGTGGDGANGSGSALNAGGQGGPGGDLGGTGGGSGAAATGDGAGGGGSGAAQSANGGAGGFGGGGGGCGGLDDGGAGGFGGGAGGGRSTVAQPGAFGGPAVAFSGGGGAGLGGAVFLRAGTLAISASRFTGNSAVPGANQSAPAATGKGKGGAIFALVPQLSLDEVAFEGSAASDAGDYFTDNADLYVH